MSPEPCSTCRELAEVLKELIRAYQQRVPAIMSTDGVWAPVLKAQEALRKAGLL